MHQKVHLEWNYTPYPLENWRNGSWILRIVLDIYEIFQDLFSLFLFGEGWQTVCSYGSIKQKNSGDFCLGMRYLLAYLTWKKWINDLNLKKRGNSTKSVSKTLIWRFSGQKKKLHTPKANIKNWWLCFTWVKTLFHRSDITVGQNSAPPTGWEKANSPRSPWGRNGRPSYFVGFLPSCGFLVESGIVGGIRMQNCQRWNSWMKMQNSLQLGHGANTGWSVGFSKGSFSSFKNPTGMQGFFRMQWMYALFCYLSWN